MAALGARVAQAVRQHVPQIRFPSRGAIAHFKDTVTSPPKDLTHHKLATTNTDKKPIGSTPRGSGVDFLELPLKYKRKPIDQVEIDYIMRGGPE